MKQLITISLFSYLLLLNACHQRPKTMMVRRGEQMPHGELVQVQSIESANSFLVILNSKAQLVKLCGVGIDDVMNTQAKKYLDSLIQQSNSQVIVWPMKTNVDGSLVAEAFVKTRNPGEEKSLNAELLIAGLAIVEPEGYCDNREAFKMAEEDAKQRRVGVWKLKEPKGKAK